VSKKLGLKVESRKSEQGERTYFINLGKWSFQMSSFRGPAKAIIILDECL